MLSHGNVEEQIPIGTLGSDQGSLEQSAARAEGLST